MLAAGAESTLKRLNAVIVTILVGCFIWVIPIRPISAVDWPLNVECRRSHTEYTVRHFKLPLFGK